MLGLWRKAEAATKPCYGRNCSQRRRSGTLFKSAFSARQRIAHGHRQTSKTVIRDFVRTLMAKGTRTRSTKAAELSAIAEIRVAGFKSINDEQNIEIRPLTILAGANSSG